MTFEKRLARLEKEYQAMAKREKSEKVRIRAEREDPMRYLKLGQKVLDAITEDEEREAVRNGKGKPATSGARSHRKPRKGSSWRKAK